jgi:hypothetical protein
MEAQLITGIIAAATVVNSGLVVWNFMQSPSKKNAEAIAALQGMVATFEKKLAEHELTLKNMPSKDTVHALDLKVTTLTGTVNVVAESLQAVERTAHRIEEFLLNAARK